MILLYKDVKGMKTYNLNINAIMNVMKRNIYKSPIRTDYCLLQRIYINIVADIDYLASLQILPKVTIKNKQKETSLDSII